MYGGFLPLDNNFFKLPHYCNKVNIDAVNGNLIVCLFTNAV